MLDLPNPLRCESERPRAQHCQGASAPQTQLRPGEQIPAGAAHKQDTAKGEVTSTVFPWAAAPCWRFSSLCMGICGEAVKPFCL